MKKDKIAPFHSDAVLLHCQTSTSRWLNLLSLVKKLQLMLVLMTLNLILSGVKVWTVMGAIPQEKGIAMKFAH